MIKEVYKLTLDPNWSYVQLRSPLLLLGRPDGARARTQVESGLKLNGVGPGAERGDGEQPWNAALVIQSHVECKGRVSRGNSSNY